MKNISNNNNSDTEDNLQYLMNSSTEWILNMNHSSTLNRTQTTYRGIVKVFFEYLRKENCLYPKAEDMKSYIALIKSDHKPSTVKTYFSVLRQLFRYYEEKGIYPNITEGISPGLKNMGDTHKKDPISEEEARRLISSIDRDTLAGLRDYAMISLMLTTGIRTISVVNAKIEDLSSRSGIPVLNYLGKGHTDKDLFVKLTPNVDKAIRAYLDRRAESEVLKSESPLFGSTSNRNRKNPMTTRSVSKIVKERLKAIGIDSERVTAHSLRHTAATICLAHGVELPDVQDLLAHKNINTTMIYQHEYNRMKNRSEFVIENSIF